MNRALDTAIMAITFWVIAMVYGGGGYFAARAAVEASGPLSSLVLSTLAVAMVAVAIAAIVWWLGLLNEQAGRPIILRHPSNKRAWVPAPPDDIQ